MTKKQEVTKGTFPLSGQKCKYLGHIADCQLQIWGDTLEKVLEQCIMVMPSCWTDTRTVKPPQIICKE